MRFTAEYSWLQSYLDNDSFWLEDTISWDDTFDLLLTDYNIYTFLTSAFFVNSHFFLDSLTKMSFLDILFSYETDEFYSSREFFDFVMWDHLSSISNNFFFSQFLFYTDYQDFFVIILHHSPELTLALEDFKNSYWANSVMNYIPSAVFDVFNDSMYSALSEFADLMVNFLAFIWLVIIFNSVFRILKLNNPLEIQIARIHYWLFWMSKEARFEFEAFIKAFFIFFLYTTMMIATFDDDQEELLEFVNGMLFNFFVFMFFYLVFKSSVHYLTFLEASVTEGRTLSFVVAQFRRDVINNFAFILRFGTLIARVNIYDANDDILDSYYIFLGDFDDDEYNADLFMSVFSTLFFDTDNNDDRSFF